MKKISKAHAKELASLATQGNSSVDTSDAPELMDWNSAERGRFYRPIKKQVTLRIDEDVLAWFKSGGDKYQTRINLALREYIDHQQR